MSGGKSDGTWISGEAVAEGRSALENGGQYQQTAHEFEEGVRDDAVGCLLR